jgi:hypothetical protein
VLLDVQDDVQPDPVHQLERGLTCRREQPPHAIDVLGPRHSLVDDYQALTFDRRPDPVEDEPVALSPHMERHEPVQRQP